jgi:Protein of unknown function (DUF3085)
MTENRESMKLTFNWSDIQRLIDTTRAAKTTRPLYEEDTGKGLWLVGDEGVYLMSNAALAEGEKLDVVYARECNPETVPFDQCWSVKRQTFGGDDGVEFISLENFEALALVHPVTLAIDFSHGSFGLEALAGPGKPRGPEVQ